MITKKSIIPNGIDVDQAAVLPSAHLGASQTGSHFAGRNARKPGRTWGFHLVRRNSIFHFRRRWPEKLRKIGAPAFLSVSLRTHVLSEAVKRSAEMLAFVEAGEKDVLLELQNTPVNAGRVQAMLREITRRAVAQMIARQESESSVSSQEVQVAQIAAEGIRIRDGSVAQSL